MANERAPHEHERAEHKAAPGAPLTQREQRRALEKVRQFLGFADLMAVLMVLATAFSAYATWRTAKVTNQVLLVAQRPFIGLRSAKLLPPMGSDEARVVLDYRNFGHIPASGALVIVKVLVNGKTLPSMPGHPGRYNVGVISPNVPHRISAYVPSSAYPAIVSGASHLLVAVRVSYNGPLGRLFCYNVGRLYDWRTKDFTTIAGNDRCGREDE